MSVTFQQTIAREAVFEGIGLHTGNITSLKFLPSPANSGVTFVRTDIRDHPRIPATVDRVIDVVRGTTIAEGNARVHTVEHILSSLYGLGLDNLEIHMDASEPPVADGSSLPFADVLMEAGLVTQDAPRKIFAPKSPILYQAGQTFIQAEPADELILDCTILYSHPLLSEQHGSFVINKENYLSQIARARTFCFDFEVEALKRNGLAKGGSLDNAVVVGMDRIHNKEKSLRFPDEFVRHKALDLLGDLYLLGYFLEAKVTAVRLGHGHNIAFTKELKKHAQAQSADILKTIA